jgi:hypothetical protein
MNSIILREDNYVLSVPLNHSSIFKPLKRGSREYLLEQKFSTTSDVDVVFTGYELDMADQEVFLNLMNKVLETQTNEISFKAGAFLREIERKVENTNWLKESLGRMAKTRIELTYTTKNNIGKTITKKYIGGLISSIDYDTEDGLITCLMDENIISLFTYYSYVDKNILLNLETDLAKWLYCRYATLNKNLVFPYKIETILTISGSKNSNIRSFKQKLIKSAEDVSSKTGWQYNFNSEGNFEFIKKAKKQ